MKTSADEVISYEKAVGRLEEIVEEMENGRLSLEESLIRFEEAIRLSRICKGRLEETRQKAFMLLNGDDGSLGLEEISPAEVSIDDTE